jgi:Helix-turn-helix domain
VNSQSSAARAYAFEDEETDAAPAASDGFSIGAYLASQRRLRGLSLDELEGMTRVPRRSLARLEAGAFDRQQDAFVRGFVRTVAVAIGLDPADTLVRMLAEASGGPKRRPAVPVRLLLLVLGALVSASGLALALSLVRGIELPETRSVAAISDDGVTLRRDYVRELAEIVRNAPPGTFQQPRPMLAPPEMFISLAGAEIPLDAVFPDPASSTVAPAPAAVSAGPDASVP